MHITLSQIVLVFAKYARREVEYIVFLLFFLVIESNSWTKALTSKFLSCNVSTSSEFWSFAHIHYNKYTRMKKYIMLLRN